MKILATLTRDGRVRNREMRVRVAGGVNSVMVAEMLASSTSVSDARRPRKRWRAS